MLTTARGVLRRPPNLCAILENLLTQPTYVPQLA